MAVSHCQQQVSSRTSFVSARHPNLCTRCKPPSTMRSTGLSMNNNNIIVYMIVCNNKYMCWGHDAHGRTSRRRKGQSLLYVSIVVFSFFSIMTCSLWKGYIFFFHKQNVPQTRHLARYTVFTTLLYLFSTRALFRFDAAGTPPNVLINNWVCIVPPKNLGSAIWGLKADGIQVVRGIDNKDAQVRSSEGRPLSCYYDGDFDDPEPSRRMQLVHRAVLNIAAKLLAQRWSPRWVVAWQTSRVPRRSCTRYYYYRYYYYYPGTSSALNHYHHHDWVLLPRGLKISSGRPVCRFPPFSTKGSLRR